MNTLKSIRKALGLSALPLLLALAVPQVGCLGQRGPSEVAQGHRYESGDPTYDQFFSAVHALQLEMAKAPGQEESIRTELAKPLGVEPEEEEDETPVPAASTSPGASASAAAPAGAPSVTDAYGDQLKQSALNAVPGAAQVNAVSQQVQQAKQTFGALGAMFSKPASPSESSAGAPASAPTAKKRPKAPSAALIGKALKSRTTKLGLQMKLDVDREALRQGESKASLRTAGEPESDEAKRLVALVEKSAKRELEIIVRMAATKKKLDKLSSISGALEASVDDAFRKSRGRASEVRKNLGDAQALIELMRARADEVSKKADRMLSRLEDAAAADLATPTPTGSAVADTSANKQKAGSAPKTKETAAAKSKAASAPSHAETSDHEKAKAESSPTKTSKAPATASSVKARPGRSSHAKAPLQDFEP